jgi:hypothetical protein
VPGTRLAPQRQIADLLGIPYDQYAQVGMFPIAYTIGTGFKKGLPQAGFRSPDLQRLLAFTHANSHNDLTPAPGAFTVGI